MLKLLKNRFKSIAINIKRFFQGNQFCFITSWKASKSLLVIRIILEMLIALIPFGLIFLGKEIINLLVAFSAETADINWFIHRFVIYIAGLLLLELLGKIMQNAKECCGGIHKDLISRYINNQLVQKSVSLDLSYFDSAKFYDEFANAKRDSVALQTLTWFMVDIIRSGIQFIISIVILAKLNIIFAVILVVSGIPAILGEKEFTAKVYNWQRSRVPEERKMDYILGILTGRSFAKDIRLYGLHEEILSKYNTLWEKWFGEKRSITVKKSIWVTLLSVIPELGAIGMMFYVGIGIIFKSLTIGDYSLYSGIVSQLRGSIYMLVSLVAQIYDNDLRLKNYKNFLSWKSNLSGGGSLKPQVPLKIDFVNVSFKYPETEEYILNKLNFSISENEKVALVGHNGAGKSTIIKLLLRFYDPTEGAILINGVDAREYDVYELRKCFSVMFQDYASYAFTIRENITLADLDSKDDEYRILEASRKSGVQSIAQKYQSGLDTYLTRQFEAEGKELSNGEWQKIALARTFFRDGSIIILDEPSSSLDPEAENAIFQKFSELCKGKGSIFISHRLSNVIMADRIIVLEKGNIIESGSHDELLKKSGKYKYLFNLQADKYKVGQSTGEKSGIWEKTG